MSLLLNVGGDWDFCFDPENDGIEQKWFEKHSQKTQKVTLPHLWNTEKKKNSVSVGFYFKKFHINEDESSKRFFIRFESIYHYATVWLNGEELGSHIGGHIFFDLDASRHVLIGQENNLVIRVQEPDKTGFFENRKLNTIPTGSIYDLGKFSGILGNIHFLMGGRAGIRAVNCFPDFEADRITIETKFWNPKNYKADLEFTLTTPDGKAGTLPKFVKLEKENDSYSITLDIDKAIVWSPESPKLYGLKVDLLGSYFIEMKFGLRRVEIERNCFKINHKIKRLRGVNFQQIFPFTHAIPTEEQNLEEELKLVLDAGFNCLRSSGVPFPNSVLDICDELGLLVIQETTCYNQKSSKEGLDELKDQIESLISLTGYHPCIIAWGIGSENGSMVLENGNKLLRFACEIDPYRPIISNFNSVYLDSKGKGTIDLGKVFNPTVTKIDQFESHKLKLSIPVPTATQNLLSSYCSSKDSKKINDGIHGDKSFWERYNYHKEELDGKIMVDGFGLGVPQNADDILASPQAQKYDKTAEYQNLAEYKEEIDNKISSIGIWKNSAAFMEEAARICYDGVTRQIESLLINPQISGYFFEHWSDFGNNFSGLVDWFRNPKPLLQVAKSINNACKIMSEAEIRNPYMGTSAAINISILNENIIKEYSLLIRVKGPNGRIWHQESMPGKAKPGINSVGRFKFPVGMEKGWFTFDLTLSQGKKDIDKKEEVFFVPPKVELEPLLKEINFLGSFSDTISYASNPDSAIIVANNLNSIKDIHLNKAFEKVKNGSCLILGALSPDEVSKLNSLNQLNFEVNCFHSTCADSASFHYLKNHPVFNDMPSDRLLDQSCADVMPLFSLENIPESQTIAGSITLNGEKPKEKRVELGADLVIMPLGKGQLIFNQFKILDILGKNALADHLFSNLISHVKKS